MERFVPPRFRKSVPVVNHVLLHGAIGIGGPMRPALTFKSINPLLERAFRPKGLAAVAISINSPGGSPVQSALIHARIRELAAEKDLPVLVFCEDVAASGGYWLACAGDEIYADDSSVIGSIGVISAGFGFVDAIAKLGVERRVHAAGDSKSMLDPFQPEKPEDVAHLKGLQADVHQSFKDLVRKRRGRKLSGADSELFSGAFWSGRQALSRGLIDGIGHLHPVLKLRFGEKVVIRNIQQAQGWGIRRLGFGVQDVDIAGSAIEALETRALWSRFGL
ncbi:S49 family peptidase [Aestuariivirga sp.]|uniref:S49 family peptidase n=1 Tax=Aestuariivirga sp. TaxID=2650926 RepID=UPI0037845BC9